MRELPKHVMIVIDKKISDFNGSESVRVDDIEGSARVAISIITHASRLGIQNLSFLDLGNDKHIQEPKQSDVLLNLLFKEIEIFNKSNIKLKFTANHLLLSKKTNKKINDYEMLTNKNSGMLLNIILNYSFAQELVDVSKKLMVKCQAENTSIEDISESMLSNELSNYELGDIELFVHTGSENNLGDYSLWQLAYSELYFFDSSRQNFCCQEFDLAIDWFCNRERRFGQTSEQLVLHPSNKVATNMVKPQNN